MWEHLECIGIDSFEVFRKRIFQFDDVYTKGDDFMIPVSLLSSKLTPEICMAGCFEKIIKKFFLVLPDLT